MGHKRVSDWPVVHPTAVCGPIVYWKSCTGKHKMKAHYGLQRPVGETTGLSRPALQAVTATSKRPASRRLNKELMWVAKWYWYGQRPFTSLSTGCYYAEHASGVRNIWQKLEMG